MLSLADLIRVAAASAAALLLAAGATANAQCCDQPAVGYTPVAQTAYMPVAQTAYSPVVQTATAPGWYPGMYLRRLFGLGDPVVGAAYTTTAYQPTYPPSYSAGYAPTTYSVGYAPAAYSVGYAPAVHSVGYAPTAYTAGYRAVTLSPVAAADPCACSSCGVVTAGYDSSCPSCAGGASQTIYQDSPSNFADQDLGGQGIPNPAIDPSTDVLEERRKPAAEEDPDEKSLIDGEEATYFQAPPLIGPQGQDRVTRTPSAPVWTAVYKRDTQLQQTSATTRRAAQAQRRTLDASGWTSASN